MSKKEKVKDQTTTPDENCCQLAKQKLVAFAREQRRRELEFIIEEFDHFDTETLLDFRLSRGIESCAYAEAENKRRQTVCGLGDDELPF